MGSRPDPPHSALTLLVQASRVSPELRAAVAEVEEYINAQVTDYDDATDCVVCAQLATDRDDALREVAELGAGLENVRSLNSALTDACERRDAQLATVKAALDQYDHDLLHQVNGLVVGGALRAAVAKAVGR